MKQPLRWAVVAFLLLVAAGLWLWSPTPETTLDGPARSTPARVATQATAPRRPLPGVPGEVPGADESPLRPPGLERPDSGAAADAATALAGDGGDPRAQLAGWLARNAALAEQHVDEFCDEARAMKRAPPAAGDGHGRDASSFLTVRIDWEDNVRPPGLLHLPEPLRARLRSYGVKWPASIRDEDLASVDFSWMEVLHQFDHWNLMAEGPLRDSRDRDFYTAPIPNFIELQSWTKLRFARALRTHDFAAASADVHQLAALLNSTGLLIADMVAVVLLNLERAGLEAATAAGLAVPTGLAYEAEDTALQRRLGRVAMYFFYPGVSVRVMKKAFGCNPHWKCSAIFEGLGAHTTLAELAPAETAGTVSALASASGCNPELLDWIHHSAPRTAAKAMESFGEDTTFEKTGWADAGL